MVGGLVLVLLFWGLFVCLFALCCRFLAFHFDQVVQQ